MGELAATALLVALAGAVWLVLGGRARKRRDRAAEAAREAVRRRLEDR